MILLLNISFTLGVLMLPFRRKSLVKKQAINLSHPLSTTTFTTINSFTVLQWCVQDYQLFTSPFSSHWIANTDKTTDISKMHFFHGCSRIEVSYLTANHMGVVNKKNLKVYKKSHRLHKKSNKKPPQITASLVRGKIEFRHQIFESSF